VRELVEAGEIHPALKEEEEANEAEMRKFKEAMKKFKPK